jgi:hypothetical protein
MHAKRHEYNTKSNQIKRTLSLSENIAYIRTLLESNKFELRSALTTWLCEHFGFHDPHGHIQRAGCLKALRELESAGHFSLPAAQRQPGSNSPRRLAEPLASVADLPPTAGEVAQLQVVLVNTPSLLHIWNELMQGEHPQGAGPLVGRQLRYLIGSAQGWLGGFGFAAPALHLADRDAWIGWESEQRRDYLHYVVNISRFLIRPNVSCRNLVSKVLSMSLSVLPADFEQEYGYRPWLVESFVDSAQFFRGLLPGGELDQGRQDPGTGPAGSFQQKGVEPQGHLCLSFGRQLQSTHGIIAQCRSRRLGAERWIGQRSLGTTRIRRRPFGRCPPEQEAGQYGSSKSRSPRARLQRRGQR